MVKAEKGRYTLPCCMNVADWLYKYATGLRDCPCTFACHFWIYRTFLLLTLLLVSAVWYLRFSVPFFN